MSVPASIKAAAAPQVNLVPPEVAKRRARGRSRSLILVALAGFMALLLGLVYVFELAAASAESALEEELARTAALQAEIAQYEEVPRVKKELANADNARQFAAATEIDWTPLLQDILDATPDTVRYETVTWSPTTLTSLVGQDNSPFGSPDIGVISLTGTSTTYYAVAALEDALNAVPGLHAARFVTVTRNLDDQVVHNYTGEVRITAERLTFRWSSHWFERKAFVDAVDAAKAALEEAEVVLDDEQDKLKDIDASDTSARAAQQRAVDDAEQAVADAQAAIDAAVAALEAYDLEQEAVRLELLEKAKAPKPEPSAQPSQGADAEGGDDE